ncbi:WD40/YVTN/BNR-like repeat-containing protein [Streptomyces phaeochromogenes]|uniref:WD40/YVTN/BNR-like repeat-containing protein n=1 Tax=Streptomyces phaeochromogenes TaxID=1923 RepID=UPI0038680DDA|nr:glycoside hydrolase [Streptomyces phaeochromogenes]
MLAAVLGVSALLGACAEGERGRGGASGAERSSPAGASSAGSSGAGSSGAAADPAAADGVTPPRTPSATGLPGSPSGVDFAADGSGFALFAECGKKRCRQSVAVLDRGADAWRPVRSPLPDVTGDLGITVGLMGLGPGRALITEGTWPPTYRTWFTGDGGRTWRTGSEKPSGTTPAVPEGGALVQECVRPADDGNACARSRLLAVLPATGEFRVLAEQPPLEGVVSPAGEPGGQLLLASGADPESGLPALAVSEDRGRTWRTARLPGTEKHGWGLRVVANGSVLYATQPGQLPDEDDVKNGLLAIHRSTDAGHTWQRVWKHRKGVEPRSSLGDLVAAADGSLTVHGEDGVWRSTDGGHTFQRGSGSRGISGSVTATPLGYLWTDSFGAGAFRISTDGTHWHRFELGDGD